jgi:hypothetical protein
MRVKCISETIAPGSRQALVDWVNDTQLEITAGKTYVVLAIAKYEDVIFYFVLGDESENYPLAFPAELFQIVDGRVSVCWETNLTTIDRVEQIDIENREVLSFKEWVLKKDEFYEKVLDEEKTELATFRSYRDKMVHEDVSR